MVLLNGLSNLSEIFIYQFEDNRCHQTACGRSQVSQIMPMYRSHYTLQQVIEYTLPYNLESVY